MSLEGGTCVAQSALSDAVSTRGGKIAEEGPVRLRVQVRPRDDGQVGVEIGGDAVSGPLATRRFVASSCADATDALGLVVALAAEEAELAAAAAAPVSEPQVDAPTPEEPPPAKSVTPHTPTTVALDAAAVGTTFGEGQIGARVGAALEWRRTFLPWIEISGATTFARTIHGGGGGADPTWYTGRLAASPVGTQVGSGLHLSLFGFADVGALNVEGSGNTKVESRTRPWFAIGAGVRARWDLGARLFAGLDAAAIAPIVRDDFVFINGGSTYRSPAVGAETAIFIGVHFP